MTVIATVFEIVGTCLNYCLVVYYVPNQGVVTTMCFALPATVLKKCNGLTKITGFILMIAF